MVDTGPPPRAQTQLVDNNFPQGSPAAHSEKFSIRRVIKSLLPVWSTPYATGLAKLFPSPSAHMTKTDDRLRALAALHLQLRYPDLAADITPSRPFRHVEAQVFSQNGEDGILLWLFSHLGVRTRTFVEIGCGDATECNTTNLFLSFNWSGAVVDGDADNVRRANQFFSVSRPELGATSQIARHQFVTVDTVGDVFESLNDPCGLDLLSIDIDGNDYWVWEAVEFQPAVVVIEYNASFGPDRSITIPYDPIFNYRKAHSSQLYHGASLRALTQLAHSKEYALVGCDSTGVNGVYVLRRLLRPPVLEISVEDAWTPNARRDRECSAEEQWKQISHLPYVTL